MFEAYFFDKRATINYRVYRVLKALQNTNFTVNRLSQEAQLSYSQAYNAFQDIIADLQQLSDVAVDVADEAAFSKLADDITVDQYRFHLLKSSMAFAFFDYLFRAEDPDVHVFCEEHAISISTLRRRVEAFRTYLHTKGVDLNTSTWGLEGSELRIRMVLINFFILGYRGVGWPFSAANLAATQSAFAQIKVDYPDCWFTAAFEPTKQDLMALAIQHLRIAQGHPLPQELGFLQLTQAPGTTTLPNVIAANTPQISTTESGFFYFYRIHFLSLSPELTPIDKWLLKHFQARNGAVAQFADGLLAYLDARLPEDAPDALADHEHLRANLYRLTYSYWVFGGDFAKRLDFYVEDQHASTFGQLPALIDTYFDTLAEPASAIRPFASVMHRELYSLIRSDYPTLDADHQLGVAVLIEPGTFTLRDILHFLDGIDFVRLATAEASLDADVIITTLTSHELIDNFYGPDHAPVIQWQSMAGEEDYYHLYAELLRRHHDKNTANAG